MSAIQLITDKLGVNTDLIPEKELDQRIDEVICKKEPWMLSNVSQRFICLQVFPDSNSVTPTRLEPRQPLNY